MNEQVTVTQILDDFAKHGHSDKTGKDWSMSRVGLSNGESVFIFNPIAVGDAVEAKENNGYKNWAKVNPKAQAENAKHDEVVARLDRVERLLKAIYVGMGMNTTQTPKASQTAPTQSKPTKPWEAWKKDDVAPMNPNDEIKPEDIPDFLQ